MKRLGGIVLVMLLAVLPQLVRAGSHTYTMANFWSIPHDAPLHFTSDGGGGFYGYTAGGSYFTQQPVLIDSSIRLQKFTIGEAYFYVSDRGVIVADSDLVAVSTYLARQTGEMV